MSVDRPSQLIDLALQGGGSHGAFTWGVLDRLLEEPWLCIEAISGTSAGAMNAAVMVDGRAAGGNERAREALEAFWRRVSRAAALSPCVEPQTASKVTTAPLCGRLSSVPAPITATRCGQELFRHRHGGHCGGPAGAGCRDRSRQLVRVVLNA